MRESLFGSVVSLLVMASPLFASSEGGDAGGDIMAGSIMTSVFAVVIFGLLLMILGKYAWGPILSSLQKREEHIRNTIEEAQNARQDAEKALADYKEQLTKANEEAQAIIEKGRSDASRLAQDLQDKAKDEAGKLRDRARKDIASAKNQALNEIYEQVTVLATEMAGKIISKTLSPDDHRQLLVESLNQLQGDQN